jgi:hypothetical protein
MLVFGGDFLEIKDYIKRNYNRKKQFYRITLGFQQLGNHPAINIAWILFIVVTVAVVCFIKRLKQFLDIPDMIRPVLDRCVMAIELVLPVLCLIGILEVIGYFTAIKDESNLKLVFGNKRDIEYMTPILIYKRYIKNKGVTVREFYTTIPMKEWLDKKESISDSLNITIVGDIEYGGNNDGNRIIFKSVKCRKLVKKDVLYDDTF